MLTYKDLIETFEIIAKYDGGLESKCTNMWAEHDEHGISFDSDWELKPGNGEKSPYRRETTNAPSKIRENFSKLSKVRL